MEVLPQGHVEEGQLGDWLRHLAQEQGPLSGICICYKVLPFPVESSSVQASHASNVAWHPFCTEPLPTLSTWSPLMAPSQLERLLPGEDSSGHKGIARIWRPPEKKRVQLSTLACVKNSWLPVRTRAVVYNIPWENSEPAPATSHHQKQEEQSYVTVAMERAERDGKRDRETRGNFIGFRTWRFSTNDPPGIKQVFSRENTTPLEGNTWSSQICPSEEREETDVLSSAPSGRSQLDGPYGKLCSFPAKSREMAAMLQSVGISADLLDSPILDTRDVPRAKAGFSSITISARILPQAAVDLPRRGPIAGSSTDGRGRPVLTTVPSQDSLAANCSDKPALCPRTASMVKMTEPRQDYCSGEEVTGTRTSLFRHSVTDGESRGKNSYGSSEADWPDSLKVSPQETVWSCTRLEVPINLVNSVLYLNRPLSVSLGDSESEKYRSTLSLRVESGAVCRQDPLRLVSRSRLDKPKRPLSCPGVPRGLELKLGITTPAVAPQIRRLPDYAENSTSNLHKFNSTPALLFGESKFSSRDAASQTVVAVHEAHFCQCFSRSPQDPTGIIQVDDYVRCQRAIHGDIEVTQSPAWTVDCGSEPLGGLSTEYIWSRTSSDPQNSTLHNLTLREALALFRPDFIARSQGRVKEVEQRALQRRAAKNSSLGQGATRGRRRRNYTKPHPLSDNLFKPRDRVISGKEMQRRSKRIYSKLPEVTKKKEEEKKKAVSQTNRMRAELFKKKILDQILQRNSD